MRENCLIGQRQLRRTPPSHRMLEETPTLFVNRGSVGPYPATSEQEARVPHFIGRQTRTTVIRTSKGSAVDTVSRFKDVSST